MDDLKKFLKEQKELKEEISRFSPASIDKVKEEVEFLIKNVRYLSHSVVTDSAAVSNLKNSVITELKNCEVSDNPNVSFYYLFVPKTYLTFAVLHKLF